MPRATSKTTVSFMKAHFRTFGFLRVVYSDNGSHFRGSVTEFLRAHGVRHIYASPYSPSSVGLAERYVQLFKVGLQKELQSDLAYVRD